MSTYVRVREGVAKISKAAGTGSPVRNFMTTMTMTMTKLIQIHLPRLGAAVAMLAMAGVAMAQAPNTDKPTNSRSAQTIKPAPKNKVTDSIQHGTDTAGRGIAHADQSARSGINRGSEAASQPVRNLGDSLGRKLGLGPARTAPAVGPQTGAP